MTPTAHTVHGALHTALDGHALNQTEARLLFNPAPGSQSLALHILHLHRLGVPNPVIHSLIGEIQQIITVNADEDICHTELAGQLDQLTNALRDAERNDPGHVALGIKALARALRRPLADLPTKDGVTYFRAAAAIKDVIARTTHDQLCARSLRHELGAGPHDRLLALLEALPC